MEEQEIFLSALKIEAPSERTRFVETACADDLPLLERVKSLLRFHLQDQKFLSTPAVVQVSDALGTTALEDSLVAMSDVPPAHHSPMAAEGGIDRIGLHLLSKYFDPPSQQENIGRLAHYELLEVIGQGAFGTVFRAIDEKLQRIVAVKVIALDLAVASPARKRFLREAQVAAAVRHPNVVAIFAVEEFPIPYLVMEFVPGMTLQQRLNDEGPLDLEAVLRIAVQIAAGLDAAHQQNLIHRDIKPGNILLESGPNPAVKISDFGLARTSDDASISHSGMIAGTPLYMAPEQALGLTLDHRADLFSLGSVIYQMLSGRPPFRAPTTLAVMKRVVEDTPRSLEETIPEIPVWMRAIVQRLHAKKPEERFRSANELYTTLNECLDDIKNGPKQRSVLQSQSIETKQHQSRGQHSGKRVVLLLGTLLVGTLALLMYSGTLPRLVVLAKAVVDNEGLLLVDTSDPKLTYYLGEHQVILDSTSSTQTVPWPTGEHELKIFQEEWLVEHRTIFIKRGQTAVIARSHIPLQAAASERRVSKRVSDAKPSPTIRRLLSAEYTWSTPVSLGVNVNSTNEDSHPTLSADGLCLVFFSEGDGEEYGLFECRRQSTTDPFGPRVHLSNHLVPDANLNMTPTLSPDGLHLIFASHTDCTNLYQTHRATRDSPWEPAVLLSDAIVSDVHETYGRVTSDGLKLYFCSNRHDIVDDNLNIWRSERATREAPWPAPSLVEPRVNTLLLESCPHPLQNGRDLLFVRANGKSNNGFPVLLLHLGVLNDKGTYDVQVIDSPVEHSFWLAADEQTVIFSSTRPDGLGSLDLWQTQRVPVAAATDRPAAAEVTATGDSK